MLTPRMQIIYKFSKNCHHVYTAFLRRNAVGLERSHGFNIAASYRNICQNDVIALMTKSRRARQGRGEEWREMVDRQLVMSCTPI